MNKAFFEECSEASHSGQMKFPEIVSRLLEAGVESYHVDLVRGEKRYYLPDGENHVVNDQMHLERAADAFSAAQVQAAVKGSQAGQITYPQFLELIAAAGAVYYIAYLKGKRVTYFGREGDSYTEYFPGSR